MSHISASEKPAPAATPLTAPITGYGMRRKSTIAWCRTSAPRRTSEGRSCSGSSRPPRNQFTSPPAEKPRPAPVTTSARSAARSASQPEASTSSPIISGLIALSASGRCRVRVPISSSISIESVFSSGGLGAVVVLIGGSLLVGRRSLVAAAGAGSAGRRPGFTHGPAGFPQSRAGTTQKVRGSSRLWWRARRWILTRFHSGGPEGHR